MRFNPASTVFSFSPDGRYSYQPYKSSYRQRPQGFDVVAAGGVSKLTNSNIGGKWYVDAAGSYQWAAAGSPYVHHEWNGTVWSPRGILLETGRVNKLTNGWDISGAPWQTHNATVGAPVTIAGVSCRKIEEDTANTYHSVRQGYTLVGTSYAVKVALFPAERTWAYIENGAQNIYINLATGAIGTNVGFTATVTRKLAGGGFEVALSVASLLAGATQIYIVAATGNGAKSYTGTAGSGIYVGPVIIIDGGSEVGSLVPTGGTRTVDACTFPSAYLSPSLSAGKKSFRYTPNAATSTADRTLYDCRDAGTNGFRVYIDSAAKLSVDWNGTTLQSAALTWTPGTDYLPDITWDAAGNVRLWRDGAAVTASTAISALSTIGSTAYIGSDKAGGTLANGAIGEITLQ